MEVSGSRLWAWPCAMVQQVCPLSSLRCPVGSLELSSEDSADSLDLTRLPRLGKGAVLTEKLSLAKLA